MNRKLSPEETKAFQQTAQAYFGLGVSASEIIILRHQAKGEEIPDSKQLLYEATAFEILN